MLKKTNQTFNLLGCSHSFFKRWIIHQPYGNRTIENHGSIWQIAHCIPIASFNLLDENETKKCFNWIVLMGNTTLLFSGQKNSKTITEEISNILTTSNRSLVKLESDRGAKF